jgi:hypothetical protein
MFGLEVVRCWVRGVNGTAEKVYIPQGGQAQYPAWKQYIAKCSNSTIERNSCPCSSPVVECLYIFHVEISNVPLVTRSFNQPLGILYNKGHVTFKFENITFTPINKGAIQGFFPFHIFILVKFLISFLAESAMLMHHEWAQSRRDQARMYHHIAVDICMTSPR